MVDSQTLQTAINAATNAHTALHQLIHELKQGSVGEAKQALARLNNNADEHLDNFVSSTN